LKLSPALIVHDIIVHDIIAHTIERER